MSALAQEIRDAVRSALEEYRFPVNVERRLKTVPEAAKYLAISPRSLKTLMAKGDIRVVRMGARVMLDTQDLDAWVEANKE